MFLHSVTSMLLNILNPAKRLRANSALMHEYFYEMDEEVSINKKKSNYMDVENDNLTEFPTTRTVNVGLILTF